MRKENCYLVDYTVCTEDQSPMFSYGPALRFAAGFPEVRICTEQYLVKREAFDSMLMTDDSSMLLKESPNWKTN